MSLPDLYCYKFRIVHHLGNNHSGYNFIKVAKNQNLFEEEDEEPTEKKIGPFFQGRAQREKFIGFESGFEAGNPQKRRMTCWDFCMEEIKYQAKSFEETQKYSVANCFNQARKAKKKVIKTENKTKGFYLYHRLIASELSTMVREEFNKMRGFLDEIKSKNILNQKEGPLPNKKESDFNCMMKSDNELIEGYPRELGSVTDTFNGNDNGDSAIINELPKPSISGIDENVSGIGGDDLLLNSNKKSETEKRPSDKFVTFQNLDVGSTQEIQLNTLSRQISLPGGVDNLNQQSTTMNQIQCFPIPNSNLAEKGLEFPSIGQSNNKDFYMNEEIHSKTPANNLNTNVTPIETDSQQPNIEQPIAPEENLADQKIVQESSANLKLSIDNIGILASCEKEARDSGSLQPSLKLQGGIATLSYEEFSEDGGILTMQRENSMENLSTLDLMKLDSLIKHRFMEGGQSDTNKAPKQLQTSAITSSATIFGSSTQIASPLLTNFDKLYSGKNMKSLELHKLILRVVAKQQLREDDIKEEERTSLATRQINLKEIHKVLSRWNKPNIKSFLRGSSLFSECTLGGVVGLERQGSFMSHTSEFMGSTTGMGSSVQKLNMSEMKLGFQQPNNKEMRKFPVDDKSREFLKISRKENLDEQLNISFGLTKPADTFSKMFKISLENSPNFPKSFDDIPLMAVPFIVGKETLYEEKSIFGGQLENNASTRGYEQILEETLRMVTDTDKHFICSENVQNIDTVLEKLVNGLKDNKFVMQDLYMNAPNVLTLDLNNIKSYLLSEVPEYYLESNQLLYYIYIGQMHFGKKWVWLEECLNSMPITRGYMLDPKMILIQFIYLQILFGERFLNNCKQALPYERITNFEFVKQLKPCSKESSLFNKQGSTSGNGRGRFGSVSSNNYNDSLYSFNAALNMDTSCDNYKIFCKRIEKVKKEMNLLGKSNYSFIGGIDSKKKEITNGGTTKKGSQSQSQPQPITPSSAVIQQNFLNIAVANDDGDIDKSKETSEVNKDSLPTGKTSENNKAGDSDKSNNEKSSGEVVYQQTKSDNIQDNFCFFNKIKYYIEYEKAEEHNLKDKLNTDLNKLFVSPQYGGINNELSNNTKKTSTKGQGNIPGTGMSFDKESISIVGGKINVSGRLRRREIAKRMKMTKEIKESNINKPQKNNSIFPSVNQTPEGRIENRRNTSFARQLKKREISFL